MFIEPNTTIRILSNVPLDNTYSHTIHFESVAKQTQYFFGLSKHTLSNQSYQRVQKGKLRVQIKAEELYDCNYLMFCNASFGTKWFYAFITGVEYINNAVSEITFEIDVMQTWFYTDDCELMECFVEREHSVKDIIGENLVPENLELGEYICSDLSTDEYLTKNYKIVIAATVEEEGYNVTGGEYSNIYSGLYLNVFDQPEDANAWIKGLTNDAKSNGIVSVFMMPSAFITEVAKPHKEYTITKEKNLSSIDGHTPRNKKLLTYPYNFLYVSNLSGNSAVFPYEYFSTDDCQFTIAGDFSCNPGVVLFPTSYKGTPSANFDEMLQISGFPQCSWNTDTYRAWLAQSSVSTIIGAGTGVAGGLATMALASNPVTGAVLGGISIAGAVGSVLAQTYEHSIQPRQTHGTQNSYTMSALRLKCFMFMNKHITNQFAKIIDEYFDMYGYATHRVKVPNISSRPHWNYVKTVGCTIIGKMPADDMSKICKIFDNGITFWKKGSEVGNYSLINSPTS